MGVAMLAGSAEGKSADPASGTLSESTLGLSVDSLLTVGDDLLFERLAMLHSQKPLFAPDYGKAKRHIVKERVAISNQLIQKAG